MKKKYSFLQEAPMQYALGNAIRKFGSMNVARGAGVGAGVGALGNMARNAMKRDDDPTKTGMLNAAFKGGTAGAVAGGVIGGIGGKFARTSTMKDTQNALMKSGDREIINKMADEYARRAFASGLSAEQIQQNIEAMRLSGAFQRQLNSVFRPDMFKGYMIRTQI